MRDSNYELANGQRLHYWDDDGCSWVCLLDGDVLVGCQSSRDGTLDALVQNVLDQRMTMEWNDAGATFTFSLTEAGERAVERMDGPMMLPDPDQTNSRFPNDAVEAVARSLATDPRNWSKAHTTLGWFQVLSDMRRIVGGMDDAGQARFCEWLTERDGGG